MSVPLFLERKALMKLKTQLILLACLTSLPLLILSTGCGGASLDYGQTPNLESVKPNFVNPDWYDAYADDPGVAAKKYKKKVLQLDMVIQDFEELPKGIAITGSTGEGDAYRISCIFPPGEASRFLNLTPDTRITVKGLFDRIEDADNTYAIHLNACVLVTT
jgi:hypothetical protein